MSGAEGLRERKKQRTRQTIARVALDLFAENGFHRTTIKQVAEAADVAPRTVSGYFPSKEELVFPDQHLVFGELERRLTQRGPEETTAAALRAWIGWLLQEIEDTDPDEPRGAGEGGESPPALRAAGGRRGRSRSAGVRAWAAGARGADDRGRGGRRSRPGPGRPAAAHGGRG